MCDDLKFWLVTYDGHHGGYDRGGLAVVMAETKDEAIELVRADDKTDLFYNAKATPILHGSRVLYNDNGSADN